MAPVRPDASCEAQCDRCRKEKLQISSGFLQDMAFDQTWWLSAPHCWRVQLAAEMGSTCPNMLLFSSFFQLLLQAEERSHKLRDMTDLQKLIRRGLSRKRAGILPHLPQ